METEKALELCGWRLVRENKHAIWRCPCGKHQITRPKTPSDWRGDKNSMADLMKTGCPSLVAITEPEEDITEDWPECWKDGTMKPFCHCCHKILEPKELGKTFYHHRGVSACKGHHGIREWHNSEVRLAKEQHEQEEV